MKSLAFAAAFSLLALGAHAQNVVQNAAQIAKVQDGQNCPRCELYQVDLYNRQVKAKDFHGAHMREGDLSLSVFNKANFARADLKDVNAYGALFAGADLHDADLTDASFVGAFLVGANLRGANLTGANFAGAQLDKAVGLTNSQLAKACGDDTTTLSKGLHIPACK